MTAPDYRTTTESRDRVSDDVRDRGKEVGEHAKSAAADVKDSATERARDVAAEAKSQARDLVAETRSTLNDHANTQVDRLGGTLRQLADELHRMATFGDDNGTAAPLVRELAQRTDTLAQRMQGRPANDLLEDVRMFARRRPGAFLAAAAGLGFVVGRLGRGLRDAQSDSDTGWSGEPYPSTGGYGYPTGQVETQQPLGDPLTGIETDPMTTGGYGTAGGYEGTGTGYGAAGGYGATGGYGTAGTAGTEYGTGEGAARAAGTTGSAGYGAGSSGYSTLEGLEGDATEVLPPLEGTTDETGVTGTGIVGDERREGGHYGA